MQSMGQGAPARVSRGLAQLPQVVAADARYPGTVPFVVGGRHPSNGTLVLAAIGRTLSQYGGWVLPLANVSLSAGAAASQQSLAR